MRFIGRISKDLIAEELYLEFNYSFMHVIFFFFCKDIFSNVLNFFNTLKRDIVV